jgi:hypothetical protein
MGSEDDEMTLDEARQHIGAGVVHDPGHGPKEDGVISSVGERYVFVRYKGDFFGKATDPARLTLLATPPPSTNTSDGSPTSVDGGEQS